MEAPDKNDWGKDWDGCWDMTAVILGGVILTTYGAIRFARRVLA